MTQRNYEFELPVRLSAFVVSNAPFMLQSKGIWMELPEPLRNRIVECHANFQGIEITRDELDSIDDTTWTGLMELLQFYV